ncbi:MAG TPA: HYR domain-containing protein, partial [Chitinophagaceae bacterium]|nr:HYR domain-containing protein [Chitinophagaceae bacterium]
YTSNGTGGGTWSSSNTSVAMVNSSTGLVTAVSTGTANISYTVNGCGGPVSSFKTMTTAVTTAPVITCPSGSPFTRNANGSCKYTIVDGEFNATATATCGTPTLSYVMTGATTGSGSSLSGVQLNKGTNTVTWTATNGSLTTSCPIIINVIDNQPPVITCPSNITATIKGRNCNTKIKTTSPVSSDNCGSVTALTWIMTGATTGSSPATGINYVGMQTFNVGITTITYTAKDAVGNSASCSFTVTVSNPNCPNSPLMIVSEALMKSNGEYLKENQKDKLIPVLNALEIKLIPNPSNNWFNLSLISKHAENVLIIIRDITGRVLQSLNGPDSRMYRFGEKLVPGVYLVEVRQGINRTIAKVVKQ